MKDILAILQNQWVRNPERVKELIAREGERYRERFIEYALFAGCLTGRRLKQAFGDRLERFRFEEASPEIAGYSSAAFPADIPHIRRAIIRHQPKLIIGFGTVACDALREIKPTMDRTALLIAPHPASRDPDAMMRLRACAETIDELLAPICK